MQSWLNAFLSQQAEIIALPLFLTFFILFSRYLENADSRNSFGEMLSASALRDAALAVLAIDSAKIFGALSQVLQFPPYTYLGKTPLDYLSRQLPLFLLVFVFHLFVLHFAILRKRRYDLQERDAPFLLSRSILTVYFMIGLIATNLITITQLVGRIG